MQITVTITHEDATLRRVVPSMVDAIDVVHRCVGARVNYLHLIDDVRQIGEYLECVAGCVWVRVTSASLH